MKKIILDVDTGIDDALAILYAIKSKHIQVEGVTTVFGNSSLEQVTRNTLQVIELAEPGYPIPVAMGADRPLFRPMREPSTSVHGKNGIGDYELPSPATEPLNERAADFMIRKINEQPHEITLVCVGRLTNLAIALAKDPTIAGKVERLVLMGGAFRVPGNITPVSEANIHGDPEAAHRVFESGIPITMVGLDVTTQAKFQDEHLERLQQKMSAEKEALMTFLSFIFSYSFEASSRMNEGRCRLLHDPLAVAVALDPSYVGTEEHYIYIETKGTMSVGGTLADERRLQTKTNAAVCVSVDHERFLQDFIDTIAVYE